MVIRIVHRSMTYSSTMRFIVCSGWWPQHQLADSETFAGGVRMHLYHHGQCSNSVRETSFFPTQFHSLVHCSFPSGVCKFIQPRCSWGFSKYGFGSFFYGEFRNREPHFWLELCRSLLKRIDPSKTRQSDVSKNRKPRSWYTVDARLWALLRYLTNTRTLHPHHGEQYYNAVKGTTRVDIEL